MAGCNNITGFTYDRCEPNLGGIKKVWLANYVESAATVGTVQGFSGDVVTAITTAETISWVEFPMRQNVASMTSNLQVGDEGGNWVQTDLSMVFSKMETSKRVAMVALVKSEAMAVVLDSNGKYWFLGYDNPLVVSAGTGETGTAKSDPNHYTVTLQDASVEYPYEIAPSALEGTTIISA